MKRRYEKPVLMMEQFVANEYVAACVSFYVSCENRNHTQIEQGTYTYKNPEQVHAGTAAIEAGAHLAGELVACKTNVNAGKEVAGNYYHHVQGNNPCLVTVDGPKNSNASN